VTEQDADGILRFRLEPSGQLLALVVPAGLVGEGIRFLTSSEEQFQVGSMQWRTGHTIPAHTHRVIPREINRTSEVLFVRKGLVRMSLYTDEGEWLTESLLQAGDVVTLFEGGHGFNIIEDADIVEIKQGPYLGEDEKYRFENDSH